jgi:GntR family transcriptional regulator, hexuronate regulon transcriptional repressor
MERVRTHDRLYQELVRQLMSELASGKYPVGKRLPAERELAAEYQVSRPTVREAIIALEVQNLVEVRIGSGAYVKRVPGRDDHPGFDISGFELTEARLLFEGEAASLAATQITEDELAELEALVERIALENLEKAGAESADRDFHLTIARATRNTAVYRTVEGLWELRRTSPACAQLHALARTANITPAVDEHRAILDALRARDPAAARSAMRTHLSAVLDSLLFATEEQAIEDARRAVAVQRRRYAAQ